MAKLTLRDWLEEGPFTLALSSSFFGFYAHCGIATALFEKGYFPRKITGSSAGALVGGALSSGLSPSATRDLLFQVRKEHFWDPFPGFGLLRGRKFLQVLEKNFVPTFEKAKIPLEVAVLDLLTMRTRFLNEGPLPRAVAASCAVPLMFHPVRIGSRMYLDGGVFHKSGIRLSDPRERVLCVYLMGSGPTDSYEWGRSLEALGKHQRVLRLKGLPRVDPNSLEQGPLAFEEGYRRCNAAFSIPAGHTVLDA